MLADVRVELVELRCRAVTRLHDGDHALTPPTIGHTHDDGVEHRRVALQRRLDLFGVHLLAAGVDGDRTPPEQRDRAVLLDAGVITRHRPPHTVDHRERGGGLLLVLVVAEGAAAGELADHADGGGTELVVEDGRLRVHGEPRDLVHGRAGRRDRLTLAARLRRSVPVHDEAGRHLLGQPRLHRRRQDRAAGEDHGAARHVDGGVELVERLD